MKIVIAKVSRPATKNAGFPEIAVFKKAPGGRGCLTLLSQE